jgi:hypothetical protein
VTPEEHLKGVGVTAFGPPIQKLGVTGNTNGGTGERSQASDQGL